MPVTFLGSKAAEARFVERICDAVRANDLQAIRREIVVYSEIIGLRRVEELLDSDAPMKLELPMVARLLKLMSGDDEYNGVVTDLLSEVIGAASKEGFQLGKDFSYYEDPDTGLPGLLMSKSIQDRIEKLFSPSAWRQCLPYLNTAI